MGGYYDAGDNVKFGLPMAFTTTMMSWSILEYGGQMAATGELGHAIEAVKWATDYFIKAHPQPYVLYGEVPSNFFHSTLIKPSFLKELIDNQIVQELLGFKSELQNMYSQSQKGWTIYMCCSYLLFYCNSCRGLITIWVIIVDLLKSKVYGLDT